MGWWVSGCVGGLVDWWMSGFEDWWLAFVRWRVCEWVCGLAEMC